ncbi:hypothetical protein Tco_1199909, partial [Tanacetum coccineum]
EPYGTVVDVFIPNRKSKSGKRFVFIRFIKAKLGPPKYASRSSHRVNPKPANHVSLVATSFVSAVKGNSSPFVSKPALVLDESTNH